MTSDAQSYRRRDAGRGCLGVWRREHSATDHIGQSRHPVRTGRAEGQSGRRPARRPRSRAGAGGGRPRRGSQGVRHSPPLSPPPPLGGARGGAGAGGAGGGRRAPPPPPSLPPPGGGGGGGGGGAPGGERATTRQR